MHEKIHHMQTLSGGIERETNKVKKHGICVKIYKSYSTFFAENTSLNETERKLARELELEHTSL